MTILIVDDALFIREIIHQICLDEGISSVFEASDGEQALSLFPQIKPNLVFLDLVLPLKNGIEVAMEMKSKYLATQIVALSTLDDENIKQKALQAGCMEFINKPFKKKDIQKFLTPWKERRETNENV